MKTTLTKFASLAAGLLMMTPAAAMAADRTTDADGPWQLRVRALVISPDEEATIETIGGNADISTTVVPELDISYFFSDNFAAELILATTPHDVTAVGTSLGDVDLGKVWLLPPTLTFQYHFAPHSNFRPYVGAGINYTIFYGGDSGAVVDVDYDDSLGWALQAGVDIDMGDTYFLNFDVKKLFLGTDVTVNAGGGTVLGADVDIDPWVFGVGVGRRF